MLWPDSAKERGLQSLQNKRQKGQMPEYLTYWVEFR
jgi:hypothetical protein